MTDAWDDDPPPTPPRGGFIRLLTRYRTVLFVAGILWLGAVMGGGIMLSAVDARYGLHVFGAESWVAGEPAAIRAALRDLSFNRYQPLGPLTVRLTDAEGNAAPEQRITDPAGQFVQGAVTAPGRPGTWQVEIDAEGPDGPVTARFPIEVRAAAPAPEIEAPPETKHPPRPDTGPWKLELRPLDGVLPGGLPGALLVRARDAAGAPLSTEVRLDVREGRSTTAIPSAVVTDRHGIATIDVVPIEPMFLVELRAGEAADDSDGTPDDSDGTPDGTPHDSDATGETVALRRVAHTPTQFSLALPPGLARPGATLPAHIRSLHRDGVAFIDVWHDDRWLTTSSVELRQNTADARVTLPALPVDPAIVWVQTYRSGYAPGDARAGQWVLVTTKPPLDATRWLADALAARGYGPTPGIDESPRLLRALLGQIPRPPGEPPLLADSGVTAKQTVSEIKTVWRSRLVIGMVGSGVVLFLVLAGLIWSNQRTVQRRWVEAGGDEDGAPGTRKRLLVDAGYMFLVLALFLVGMIQLMLTIRW